MNRPSRPFRRGVAGQGESGRLIGSRESGRLIDSRVHEREGAAYGLPFFMTAGRLRGILKRLEMAHFGVIVN
jgi:hypothetical protein